MKTALAASAIVIGVFTSSVADAQIDSPAWYVGQTDTADRFVVFDSISHGDEPNTVIFNLVMVSRDRRMMQSGNAYSFNEYEADCNRHRSRVLRYAVFSATGEQTLSEETPSSWSADPVGSMSRDIADTICGDQIPTAEVVSAADFNRFIATAIKGGGR
ncbi:surface-adhesin E family protein [Brevundimonas nasdae]|uniref:Uncharacterized protein n=1 Tax=Brevundimonas nasdae TaxID=172043 RepID=A0ACD4VKY0_9CAUL|nr:surface-adhesin E family protein [Brevundimonas nasdae]WOB78476.1 hypothetical protein PZA08_14410 [Brevundimonas nasdae]